MSAPIGCREAVRDLWEYLDRGLDEADHRAVDEHLAFCKRCCGELEFAKELRSLLRTRVPADIPDEIHSRLEGFLDQLGSAGLHDDIDGVGDATEDGHDW